MSIAAQIEAARLRSAAQQAAQWRPPSSGRGVSWGPSQQFRPRAQPAGNRFEGRPSNPQEFFAKWGTPDEIKQERASAALDASWIGRVLGTAVGRPLSELARAGRATVAGVENLANVLPEGLEWMAPSTMIVDEDREDDRSWWGRASDPSYGFGTVAKKTGNVWADRAVGFAGDVLLDPLTYTTLGAGKAAGVGGRLTAAGDIMQLAGNRLPPEVAERLAARAARLGVSSLDDTTRAMIGLERGGLRFAGQRIAGTGGVARRLGTAGGAVRAGLGDIGPLGRIRRTKGIEEAYDILHGRRVGDIGAAAAQVRGHNANRIAEGASSAKWTKQTRQIRKVKKRPDRVAMTHAAERGADNELSRLARSLYEHAQAEGVTGLREKLNYVMHAPTRKGAQWLGKMKQTGRITYNTGESAGRAFERAIVPGTELQVTHTVGRYGELVPLETPQTVKFVDATIDEVNSKLEPLLGFKLYEDDAAVLAEAMVNTTARDIGTVAGMQRIIDDFGNLDLARREGDAQVDVLDREALADTVGWARSARDKGRSRLSGQRAAFDAQIRGARNEMQKALDARIAQAQETIGELQPQLDVKGRGRLSGPKRWRAEQMVEDAQETLSVARERANALRNKNLGVGKDYSARAQSRAVFELEETLRAFDGSPEMAKAVELMDDVTRRSMELDEAANTVEEMRSLVRAGERGELGNVMKAELDRGFRQISEELFAEGDNVVMRPALAALYQRTLQVADDVQMWKVIDDYTKLFKAWATATPGFHLRNAISAVFMNFVGGVGVRDHAAAIRMFSELRKNPERYLDELERTNPLQYEALGAALGSGMGGVGRAELGSLGTTQMGPVGNRMLNNVWTTTSKETLGEWVEGPARIAMALNTIRKGGSAEDALNRISRYQFDYSQLSEFDRKMKWVIPFWTFMSRSLPLNIQEMYRVPGKFLAAEKAFKNMTDNESDGTLPGWMAEQGGFMISDGGALIPDLPYKDVPEQLEYFKSPERFLANFNPAFRVPAEMIMDKQFFQNRPFYEGESNAWYAVENMLPPAAVANRLLGGRVGGMFEEGEVERRSPQLKQAWLNYFGIPWKNTDAYG